MTKTYKIKNLDCANCTAKIERAIKKIGGVEEVNINFMAQKLVLDAEENKLGEILPEIQKIMDKIEPGTQIIT